MNTYRARSTPCHTGPAAWNAILGAQEAATPLEGDATADFAVIGAGFAGLSAARRLTQLAPDARIAVLEAGRVAEGAVGRNSGFMIDLPPELTSEDYAGAGDDRTMISLNRMAQEFGRDAVEEYGTHPAFFDRAGKVNGAASDAAHAHNESYARHLASLGEVSEMLDAQAMQALTGSTHYRSGLYTPGTVMLQPAGYARGLAARQGDMAHAARVMQRKFDQRFPQLAGMRMEYTWAGHLCLSLNGVSVMREIKPGLYAGSVQNGLGTARGTLTGMGAAELACGETSAITRHFTAEVSPKRLPPQPFAEIGANAVLR